MSLALHQLRKDIRQFWMVLLIWAALLALNLGTDLGWLAKVPPGGSERTSAIWAGMQPFALWLLLFMTPSMVVLADSPARREGFLGTRPMPKLDLWAAKLMFIFGLIVLPVVAQDMVYLWMEGLPFRYVAQGGLERLLWILPVAVCAAAFAALWRNYTQWAAGIGIVFGGFVLSAYVLSWLENWLGPISGLDDLQAMIVTLLTMAPGLAALAVWNARRSPKPLLRWCGIALVAAFWFGATLLWPWKQVKLAPADPAAARALVEKSDLGLTPRNIRMSESSDDRHGTQLAFALDFPPPSYEAAGGEFVQWVNAGTKLLRPSGQALASGGSPEREPIFRAFGSVKTWQEIQAVAGLLPQIALAEVGPSRLLIADPSTLMLMPEDVLAEVGPFGFYTEGSTELGRFNLDPDGALLHEPIALQARLEGRAFRWKKVAELPLKAGESAKDDFGQWTVKRSGILAVILQRKQIALSLSTDQRANNPADWSGDKFAFVFYHPRRNVAFVADGNIYPASTRAADTAYPQCWLDVHCAGLQNAGDWNKLLSTEWPEFRLLIFEKTWLGNANRDWQSARFTYDDLQNAPAATAASGGESLTSGELERRLAALNRPGPGASRQAVSLYLLEYLRLLDARRFWGLNRPQDPAISGLAALTPEHLDILLDGLPAMSLLCRRAVIAAITAGALESQKDAIIAAVPRAPELASVLLARGWVGDARAALYKLLDSPRALPLESLQAIAWFADPQTYPRLLQELESNPSEPLYDALRALPGIAGPLDASVTRLWRDHTVLLRRFEDAGQALRLALREGKPEALAWACHLAEQLNSGNPIAATMRGSVFEGVVELPEVPASGTDRSSIFLALLSRRRAEDFVFDPARRRFVLKQKPNSAAEAGPRAPSS
jgi:hypothetical protein